MQVILSPSKAGLCGEYALLMVLQHLGIETSLDEIIALVDSTEGTDNEHLVRVMKHYGIECQEKTGQWETIDQLPDLAFMVIMSTKYHDVESHRGGHWVVYYQKQVYDSAIYYPVESLEAYEKLYHPEGGHTLHILNLLQVITP